MTKLQIIPVVEGHGEEEAVPVLVRRWLCHRRFDRWFDAPERAINAKGAGRLKAAHDLRRHVGIEHYVRAALRNEPDAILVILDADDACQGGANALGPSLLARARAVAQGIPVGVVVANREYEAWFLASLTSLRAAGVLPAARLPGRLAPEAPRDCKGMIARVMGVPYEERVHQVELSRALSFSPGVAVRSPSFGKLLRDLERLTQQARQRRTA